MTGLRFDYAAAEQARTAYERARRKAEVKARRVAFVSEWRAERAPRNAKLAARQIGDGGTALRVAISGGPEIQRVNTRTQRTIGWWTVMAMLLAWCGSLPLSIMSYNEPSESVVWADHMLVTMPTVVSFPAMVWFLWKVPVPRPSVGRVAGTVGLAPVLLVIGVLSFLFTLGIGSFVFAWILWRQTQIASTAKGAASA